MAEGVSLDVQNQLGSMLDYHGHSWLGVIEWSYSEDQLDKYGWGPDFGAVKDLIRKYDHHNLNLMHPQPSAENLAKTIYEEFFHTFGFKPDFVRLHEGHGNTMTYTEE
jgi:6-pyruvoyl-tetrahydropterin synthase